MMDTTQSAKRGWADLQDGDLQQMDTIGKRRQEQLQLAKKRTRRGKGALQEERPPKGPKVKP